MIEQEKVYSKQENLSIITRAIQKTAINPSPAKVKRNLDKERTIPHMKDKQ
jgi:hypothetical protein